MVSSNKLDLVGTLGNQNLNVKMSSTKFLGKQKTL